MAYFLEDFQEIVAYFPEEGRGVRMKGDLTWAGGYNRKKARHKPRGGRATGPYDGRRPCARAADEHELTLVRALPPSHFHEFSGSR